MFIGNSIRIPGTGNVPFNAETIAHITRVEADGGAVLDPSFLNRFITDAKNNGYLSDIVAAYSPDWGVKGGATASDLYSVTGAGFDLTQGSAANQPGIVSNDLNGKTRLLFDGVDDNMKSSAFTFNRPETFVLGGFRQVTWVSGRGFFDGLTLNSSVAFQNVSSPQFNCFAGSSLGLNANASVGVDYNIRVLFNDLNSESQVDQTAAITGSTGTANSGGFTLGSSGNDAANGNVKIGMAVLLNAAVDASYPAKALAVYNFSKNAYGTA